MGLKIKTEKEKATVELTRSKLVPFNSEEYEKIEAIKKKLKLGHATDAIRWAVRNVKIEDDD